MPEPLAPALAPLDFAKSPASPPRPRVPSGPRPLLASPRSLSTASVPSVSSPKSSSFLNGSITSLAHLRELHDSPAESPLDALIDSERDFTLSPESSPKLGPVDGPLATLGRPIGHASPPRSRSPERGHAFNLLRGRTEASPSRSWTAPAPKRSDTTDTFYIPKPGTSAGGTPPGRQRPKVAKLNTLNIVTSPSSPTKPLSPGLQHWQQVREHVLAPTPQDEKPSTKQQKKLGIVHKAAGKFGFRQAAENVMGYEERRRSTMGFTPNLDGLSAEQKEEIARERRRFAREVRTCLDACALEETRRRLARANDKGTDLKSASLSSVHRTMASSTPGSTPGLPPNGFDPNFSSFVPLLTELHRHLPAARTKKLWSRTCPHHAAILSELGVCFLQDGTTTDGERQQALEVFGVLVRNWASDSSDEELDRWLWLCHALLIPDRNLRNRGLPLLVSFLRADPALPPSHDRPRSATAVQSMAIALLPLLYALEMGGYGYEEHHQEVAGLMIELAEGIIIPAQSSSLHEILGTSADALVLQGSHRPEREIVWLAVGRVLGQDPMLARWLIASSGDVLERFAPPPLLGATPPVILRLRALSSEVFLTSLSRLASASTDPDTILQVWEVAARFILPDTPLLLESDSSVGRHVGSLILHLELAVHMSDVNATLDGSADPFRISTNGPAVSMPINHRETLLEMLGQQKFAEGLGVAARTIAATAPILPLIKMTRFFFEQTACQSLAQESTRGLFKRLSTSNESPDDVKPFLLYLQSKQAQTFYRPLFSLSAATNPTSLLSHLRVVRALEKSLGPARFWLAADPQMVAIVLMGDVSPKQAKGKGRVGDVARRQVKLGRYAALIEFISALDHVTSSSRKERSTRVFVDAVETRLGVILEAEEKEGDLPTWYRALVCRLLQKLRRVTLSVKKAGWQKLVIGWYTQPAFSPELQNDVPTTLRHAFAALYQNDEKSEITKSNGVVKSLSRRDTMPQVVFAEKDLIDLTFPVAAASLLATAQASLTREQLLRLLPRLWSACAELGQYTKAVVFLLMKCGEVIPDAWHELIMADLKSTVPTDRMSALRKLAMLHGWRFQVLSQVIITDRRGPIFHFPAQTVDHVATEIGSAAWVAPYDVQDVALKKFGTALPLELRQRLMELGWNEDDTMAVKSDWEQVPVSSLPSLEFQAGTGVADTRVSSPASPITGLARRGSNTSASSHTGKRRKAVFAPVLLRIVNEQAAILAHDPDSTIETASRDLVRILQRDDAGYAIRPFTDNLGKKDFLRALAGLNAFMVILTPSFAYTAFNSIVGYLKTALKSDATFGNYAPALASICHLAPHVSELSLRAIRKNKVEHVLLPASIHEEETGFKIHAAWRDGIAGVQTAQLMFLADVLRANPHEVYLVKKMLSNLPIQGSIGNLSFSRAWLVLITTLFSTVNRNYNDRAELRHFLTNVVAVLRLHGHKDLLVACHALRVLMLCSARFRRLFASVGFSTIVRSIYDLYAGAGSNMAIKDAVEYASRSFFRIHQEAYVYQASVAIAEGDHDARSAYDFLACVSVPNSEASGVPSGLKGLNDKEEVETLLTMLSVPEVNFSDIGTDAAERQTRKLASVDLEGESFPKENIVKLFLTVIAANPATRRAAHFLRLFAAVLPQISDPVSIELVREGVEALGIIYVKSRLGDDAAREIFHPGEGDSNSDWTPAKREYVFLVESFARCGGKLSSAGTKRSLDLVQDLLRKRDVAVGPVASSILRELARSHLSASGSRATAFLRGIAPIFRLFITSVDFSGLLMEITSLIRRSAYELDKETTAIIVESYVGPAVRMLASAAEDNMAFIIPVRAATIELLAAAVFLPGDAFGALERYAANPSLLASLVFPLCLVLEPPKDVDREEVYNALWIRLLHYVMRPTRTSNTRKRIQEREVAATIVLGLQTLKVIVLRAQAGISRVHGLWDYIAQHIAGLVKGGNGYFAAHPSLVPRLIDWMMWSVFEVVSLHRSPLMIELRCSIQVALSTILDENPRSPSTSSMIDPRAPVGGRSRTPSAKLSLRPRASLPPEPERSRQWSAGLTPDPSFPGGQPGRPGHTRSPSLGLSPHPGHSRTPSVSDHRPSFVDLSTRRASRPSFTVGSDVAFASPSHRMSGARPSVAHEEKGGAVVHLLGAPNHVLGAISAAIPNLDPKLGNDIGKRVTRDLKVSSPGLLAASRRAVAVCQVVFGYDVQVEEDVRVLTAREAVLAVAEETKIIVEEEFRVVFTPRLADTGAPKKSFEAGRESMGDTLRGYSLDQIRTYDEENEKEVRVPKREVSRVQL